MVANPDATALGQQSILIRWHDLKGAGSYRVLRADGSGRWTEVGSTPGGSFEDRHVSGGTTYTYRVVAGVHGKSYQTARTASATTNASPLPERCRGEPISPGTDAAAAVDQAPPGTTFCFAAGLYRLVRPLEPKQGDTLWGAPGATLSGSRIVRQWRRGSAGWLASGVLPAPYDGSAQCEDERANPCRWNEDLFFDGARMERAPTSGAVTSNSYFADYGRDLVILGRNPSGHEVEMASAEAAIESDAPDVLVRGLTIQEFANPAQSGAVNVRGDNWTVVDSDLRLNHAAGIYVHGRNDTVAYDRLDDNGEEGGGDHATGGEKVTGDEIAHNNTDGFWMADWEAGGWKSGGSSNLSFSDNQVLDNRGVGLWFDLGCSAVHVAANLISGNGSGGVRFELSSHGYIGGNRVDGNGLGTGRGWSGRLEYGGSIAVTDSRDVTVTQNELAGNSNGIAVIADSRTDGSPALRVSDVSVTSNVTDLSHGKVGLAKLSGSDAVSGVVFSANRYALPVDTDPYFVWGDQSLSLAGWQGMGQN